MCDRKSYIISATYKKSVIENQWYEKMINGQTHNFCKQLIWRNGDFSISLRKKDIKQLTNCDQYEEINIHRYDGKMESLCDCCAIDYTDYTSDTDRDIYDLQDELEDESGRILIPEDKGWTLIDTEYIIIGPITIKN